MIALLAPLALAALGILATAAVLKRGTKGGNA